MENPQLSPEQLTEMMNRQKQQKADEQEQQALNEYRVWQFNVFKLRSAFWQKIFEDQICVIDFDDEKKEQITRDPVYAAERAAKYADAAVEQWDERFLPKPPQAEVPTGNQENAE